MAVYVAVCSCITSKDLDYVAAYIQTLQDAGYETIFSLFEVSRSANSKEIAKQQSRLIKKCYMAKVKKNPMPVGKDLTEVQAKVLIVNGYKILTEKGLRSAYNWILDEAHPQFMENFRARSKAQAQGIFYAPSMLSVLVSLFFSFIVFDFLHLYITYCTRNKNQNTRGLTKKQRKAQLKSQTKTIEKSPLNMKDLYIYKGYMACHQLINKLHSKGADNAVQQSRH